MEKKKEKGCLPQKTNRIRKEGEALGEGKGGTTPENRIGPGGGKVSNPLGVPGKRGQEHRRRGGV